MIIQIIGVINLAAPGLTAPLAPVEAVVAVVAEVVRLAAVVRLAVVVRLVAVVRSDNRFSPRSNPDSHSAVSRLRRHWHQAPCLIERDHAELYRTAYGSIELYDSTISELL